MIVPQLLTRREFVEELRETAESLGATFHEIALLDERAAVLARAEARAEPPGSFGARALAARQGHTLGESYDAFVEALAARPEALVLHLDASTNPFDELLWLLGGR